MTAKHPVLTAKQAKQVTGGRTPLVPVEYESAVKSLQACVTLDEAKYWDDKSSALAAWAKIYRNDQVGIEARRLRLHAYRRIGQLAQELRPQDPLKGRGSTPGPRSLLLEQGFNRTQADSAICMATRSQQEFARIVNHPRPPAPSMVRHDPFDFSRGNVIRAMIAARSMMRKADPIQIGRSTEAHKVETVRALARDMSEWIDALEQALPKAKK